MAAAPPLAGDGRPGLRERNRARNRAEVAAVALELFDRRGFDEVTVDDIAAAAGISRRTFFRYFDSKEDAVLPYEDERLDQLREMLAARPASEPILASIRHATVAIIAATAGPEARIDGLRRARLLADCPAVHARSLALQSHWEAAIAEVIAAHLGVDPATDLEVQVIAGATLVAVRAAVRVWLATDGATDLADLVGDAYDVLTAGVTLP